MGSRELSSDGFIVSPLGDEVGHIDGIISAESIFSVLDAFLLDRPGEVTTKIEHANATKAALLLHYVAKTDFGMGSQ